MFTVGQVFNDDGRGIAPAREVAQPPSPPVLSDAAALLLDRTLLWALIFQRRTQSAPAVEALSSILPTRMVGQAPKVDA